MDREAGRCDTSASMREVWRRSAPALVATGLLAACGADNNACIELEVEAPGTDPLAVFARLDPPDMPALAAYGTSASRSGLLVCWLEHVGPGDWTALAWIDIDGDDVHRDACQEIEYQGPTCTPEPDEPMARQEVAPPTAGTTRVTLRIQPPK